MSKADVIEIVRGQLQCHLVAGKDTDEVLSQLTADMCQNSVTVFQFYLKHGVGQLFHYCAFDFN